MTMKTPEMDVVRFNEADVLAASGDPVPDTRFVTFGSWGIGSQDNSSTKDGWATYTHGSSSSTYSYQQLENLADQNFNSGSTFKLQNGTATTLDDLLANDAKDADSRTFDGSIFNGTYRSTDNGLTYWQ